MMLLIVVEPKEMSEEDRVYLDYDNGNVQILERLR